MQINHDKINGYYIGDYMDENACVYSNLDEFIEYHECDDMAIVVVNTPEDVEKFHCYLEANNYGINRSISLSLTQEK